MEVSGDDADEGVKIGEIVGHHFVTIFFLLEYLSRLISMIVAIIFSFHMFHLGIRPIDIDIRYLNQGILIVVVN